MAKSVREIIFEVLREFSTPLRPIYLVGGAVRDQLLDRPAHDFDFVLPGETIQVAREAARRLNGALFVLDEVRQTTRVVVDRQSFPGDMPGERLLLDFARFRADDLEGDLLDRDFSINAMAYDLAHPGRLIDPAGGLADLRSQVIRACSPESLESDPVRVLRAVRLALELDFRIDPGTLSQMRAVAGSLPQISAERLRDELMKMLDGPRVSLAVRILDQVGALAHVLPELEGLKGVVQPVPHVQDVWEHTLSTVQYLEQILAPLVGQYREETVADLTVGSAVLWLGRFRERLEEHFNQALVPDRTPRSLLFLAALYHDIAKPAAQAALPNGKIRFLGHPEAGARVFAERGRQLALSVDEINRVEKVVGQHMRVHFLSGVFAQEKENHLERRAIYRFFRDTNEAGIDVCLLSLADTRGTYGVTLTQEVWQSELETCRVLFEAYWEKPGEVVSPPRLVSGDDLIQLFGMRPGREIGRLLADLREAQAAGEVAGREEALTYARGWLDKNDVRGEEPEPTGK